MKYTIKYKQLILVVALICLFVISANYIHCKTIHYTLPNNLIQLSSSYCDNTLIGLSENSIYFYDKDEYNTLKLDHQYKKFCAKSKKDIVLLDTNNNAVHFYNDDFQYDYYSNIIDVMYIRNSYVFLTDGGDVFLEGELLCNIGTEANKIAGTLDPCYSINDIWFINDDDFLCVYNINFQKTIIVDKTYDYEFTPVNSMYISDEGNLMKIIRKENNYEFELVDNICSTVNDITPINEGSCYLLLINNSIKKIEFDIWGNYYLCDSLKNNNKFNLSYLIDKDLLQDWTKISLINNIKKPDGIFTSPYTNDQTNQIVFIKEQNNIFIWSS